MENNAGVRDRALDRLAADGIAYELYEHPPVHTVEEANAAIERHPQLGDVGHTKNLFLCNKKGDAHYLLVATADTDVDLGAVSRELGESRLSFASERRLEKYLGVAPGSVSPFALINDQEHAVTVLIDRRLNEHDTLGFHPNDNTATVVITSADLLVFFEKEGYQPREVVL